MENNDALTERLKSLNRYFQKTKKGQIRRRIPLTVPNDQNTEGKELLTKFADEISSICNLFFGMTSISGQGEVSWPKEDAQRIYYPPLIPDSCIIPIEGFMKEELLDLIKWGSLYSNIMIFILQFNTYFENVSYSPGIRGSWFDIEELLNTNYKYRSFIRENKCIFLPKSHITGLHTLKDYVVHKWEAPFQQKIDNSDILLPLNNTKWLYKNEMLSEYYTYKEILLPYFTNLTVKDIIRISKNESDSFVKFNFFLRKKMGEFEISNSRNETSAIIEEIDYEIANLNIEMQKISKMRMMQGANIAFMSISLGLLATIDSELVKTIAGITGSTNLLGIVKDYLSIKKEKLSLKKSDLYLPFLLKKK